MTGVLLVISVAQIFIDLLYMSYRTSVVVVSKSPSLVKNSALAKTYIYNNKILTKSVSLLLTAIV